MLNHSELNKILPDWDKAAWYYSIELVPGVYTKGFGFNNIVPTQRMLANIDLEGTTVLDIGAVEGAISLVMEKRGASVLAVDGTDNGDKINLVKLARGAKFSYFPYMPLDRFAEHLFEIQTAKNSWPTPILEIGPKENTPYGFDIVLSSGVLYHVMHPLHHLMTYRKLCKLGGLVVIECAAAISDEVSFLHSMRPDGWLYQGGSWFVTTGSMDLFLRICFFEPLAFCYVQRETIHGVDTCRFGVVARAVSQRGFDPERYSRYQEVTKSQLFTSLDFAGLQSAALLTGRASKPVEFKSDGLIPATDGIAVAAFNGSPPLSYTDDDLRFPLNMT